MKTNLLPFKIAVFVSLIFISCNTNNSSESDKKGGYTDGATTLFTKVTSETSKITFKNMIREDLEFNFLNYPYLYTGAGVATGDIDNDGLVDVYLTANFGPNKLYKNLDNLPF